MADTQPLNVGDEIAQEPLPVIAASGEEFVAAVNRARSGERISGAQRRIYQNAACARGVACRM